MLKNMKTNVDLDRYKIYSDLFAELSQTRY